MNLPQSEMEPFFKSALPVWPSFQEKVVNQFVGFRALFSLPKQSTFISIAACSLYRLTCNGRFVGHGPARTAHGFLRVDQWLLDSFLIEGTNLIAIEVAAYNANSFYTLDEPAYLQAEVFAGDETVASTRGTGSPFRACRLSQRIQKVPRYSFQRTFIECYKMDENSDRWKNEKDYLGPFLDCAVLSQRKLLPRRCPLPLFAVVNADLMGRGKLVPSSSAQIKWNDRSLTLVGSAYKGFDQAELEMNPVDELATWKSVNEPPGDDISADREDQAAASYRMYKFERNVSGFLGCSVICHTATRLYLTFDEILINDDIDSTRLDTLNIVSYQLEPGEYRLETFEPCSFQFVKAEIVKGRCEVLEVWAREYANPEVNGVTFKSSDLKLNVIFDAARETYRFNTVDLFMDCPSRERAGWLNDSIFSARSALLFSGNLKCETDFLENFLLAPDLEGLPFGMFPMCYPADIINGGFCPNLPCWFICQLEEFVERGGNIDIASEFHAKVKKYFRYLEKYRNEHGLLEKLEGWIFVEWSRANEWVQDVNIPSNLLYADALASAGRLFGEAPWQAQAKEIYAEVMRLGFNGTWFVDNLVRREGQLVATQNSSEIGQYHAFRSGIANPTSHAALWRHLVESCHLSHGKDPANPLAPANLIAGGYLRLDLLARYGEHAALLKEISQTFGPMAERTGTLWEHLDSRASCNHGIAAYIADLMVRVASGLQKVDIENKVVHLIFRALPLEWCAITYPAAGHHICLQWKKEAEGRLIYYLTHPSDYVTKVEIDPKQNVRRSDNPLF